MKYLNAKTLKQLSNLKTPYHLPIEVAPYQVKGISLVGKFGQRQKSLIVDSANLIFAKYHIELKSWKPCSKEDFEVEAKYGVRVTSTMKNFCEAQIKDSKQELDGFFKTGWIGYDVVLSEESVSSIDPNQSFGRLSVDSEPIQEFFETEKDIKPESKYEEVLKEEFKKEFKEFKDFKIEDDLARKNHEIAMLKARIDEDTFFFKENLKEKELELERLLEKLNQSHLDLSKQQSQWLHKQDELQRNLEKLEHLKELANQDRNLVQTKLNEALEHKAKLEHLKQTLENEYDQQNTVIVELNKSMNQRDQEIERLKVRLNSDTLVFKDNLKEKELALAKLEDLLNQSHADLSKQQIEWEKELKSKKLEFEEQQKLSVQDRNLVQAKLDEVLQQKTKLELLKQNLERDSDQQNIKIAKLNQSMNNKDQEIELIKARLDEETMIFKQSLREKELELVNIANQLDKSRIELIIQQKTFEAERKTNHENVQAERQKAREDLKRKQLELEEMQKLASQDKAAIQTRLDEAIKHKNQLELLKKGLELESSEQKAVIESLSKSMNEKELELTSGKVEMINICAREKLLQGKVKEITERLSLKSEEVISLSGKVTDLNKTLDESTKSFNQKLKPLEILNELVQYNLKLQKLHDIRLPMEWDANQCALQNKADKGEKVLINLKLEIADLTNKRNQLMKQLPKNLHELLRFDARVSLEEEAFWLEKDYLAFGGKDMEMKTTLDKCKQQLKELNL